MNTWNSLLRRRARHVEDGEALLRGQDLTLGRPEFEIGVEADLEPLAVAPVAEAERLGVDHHVLVGAEDVGRPRVVDAEARGLSRHEQRLGEAERRRVPHAVEGGLDRGERLDRVAGVEFGFGLLRLLRERPAAAEGSRGARRRRPRRTDGLSSLPGLPPWMRMRPLITHSVERTEIVVSPGRLAPGSDVLGGEAGEQVVDGAPERARPRAPPHPLPSAGPPRRGRLPRPCRRSWTCRRRRARGVLRLRERSIRCWPCSAAGARPRRRSPGRGRRSPPSVR